MNNQIQVVLKSSTTEMSLNDHDSGIYIVPELNGLTGLPDIRTTSGVNAGYDGGWTSAQNYDARSITLRGVIANEDKATVERMRKQLVSLLGQGKNEELTLDIVTEAGSAYEIQVRTIACEMAMQRVLTQQEFMIQLRADDPLIYDNTEAGEPAIVQVQKALGGFQIPFEIPLAIGGGEDASVIDNHGLEQVAPIVKMYGALHNPKIINQTTNQYMQIEADLGYAEGAYTDAETSDSGQAIEFNASIAAPLADFSLKGNTTQQTYTGKNLCPLIASTTSNNIIYTQNADGTYNISGTSTAQANAVVWLDDISAFVDGQTYTISVSPAPTNMSVLVEAYNNTTWQRTLFDANAANPIKTSAINMANANRLKFSLRVQNGRTVNLQNLKIQLEKNSSQTTWERYVGGIPAPNPDYPQAVQTVTGENTVKIRGKNLYKLDTGTYNTLVITKNSDGSYVLNGTPTANVQLNIDIPELSQEHTLSYTSSSTSSHVYVRTRSKDGTLQDSLPLTQTSGSVTSSKAIATSSLTVATGETFTNFTIYPQLELGSSATSFEPYQEQSYEVNLGKNLFDVSSITENTAATTNGVEGHEVTYSSNNNRAVVLIKTEPNSTYTLSFSSPVSRIYFVGMKNTTLESGHAFNWVSNGGTITTGYKDSYILGVIDVSGGGTISNISNANVQLEKGSKVTSYAAYFTPIELCKIGTYQDYIYKDGSDWKIKKQVGKFVLESAKVQSAYNKRYRYAKSDLDNAYLPASGTNYLCKYFTAVVDDSYGIGSVYSGGTMLNFRYDENGDNIAGFKNFIDEVGLSLYCQLNSFTDTTITNTALIEQLDTILNSGRTYAGTNNITTVIAAGNSQGEVQVSYYTHQDPATRDEIVIDSRLRAITLNGLDIYDKKTEGSEFLMLAPGENKLMLQSDIDGDNGYAEVNYKQGYLSI